jgi:hypothetical protein
MVLRCKQTPGYADGEYAALDAEVAQIANAMISSSASTSQVADWICAGSGSR